ncbi:MAG: WD40/YVTN/BNR-like repeat-containing protein, partial [Chitinophagaceae bacterium]
FYYVYGGTQDNFSLGGPSRTRSENGITNSDWFITTGGDGFESQADYADPNIVYAESQYGGLVRFDKRTGERVNIRPVEAADEAPYRWNWDAPLLISKHDHKRVYFASNKIFRTDDQGNTWRSISGDLSRGIDRNKLTVMGKVWSVDAVAKNQSTDIYGQLTTIAESPLDENILYAGTDDGLIHVTTDGGKSWTKIDNIPGVPERTYVNQIVASAKNKNMAYAVFNHHRYGDFKPYLFRTTDAGKTWTPIQNNLPVRGTVYTVAEDHINTDLLFIGTEFGVYFSIDGGTKWTQLKGGLPTITVKDMEIQQRESDLVIATFGRGYYVLDDYSSLRNLKNDDLQKTAFISPVKTAWMYIESTPLGVRGKGFQGESYWNAPNPKPGSVFTYYLKDDIKTLREKRLEAEKQRIKIGDAPYYPSIDSLRREDIQPAPYLLFTVADENGNSVRRLRAPAKKGINRITWDFRTDPTSPINFTPFDESNVFGSGPRGIMVLPGNYKVSLSKFEDGVYAQLVAPQPFKIEALNMVGMSDADKKTLHDFGKKVAELKRAVDGTNSYRNELLNRLRFMKEAALQTAAIDQNIVKDIISLEKRLGEVSNKLNGDASLTRREFEAPSSINNRIGNIMEGVITTTVAPTNTAINSYMISAQQFAPLLAEVKTVGEELKRIENLLEKSGAPYTPGRIPDWKL